MAHVTKHTVTLNDLIEFSQSFLPAGQALDKFEVAYQEAGRYFDLAQRAGQFDIAIAEDIICDSVGSEESSSIGNMVRAFVERGAIDIDDVLSIIEGARFFFEFMQELVQSSIEHISQGISVVDQQLRMVAWNKRYIEFFGYPEDLVRIGRPVADLIRFNLERVGHTGDELEVEVEKRLSYLKQGTSHKFERNQIGGQVLEVSGNPMPGGGFVTSYTDITVYKDMERQLRSANETLEIRVIERTRELESAKREAESANYSKTQFLAAASHDLMQPLNAANLFAAALSQRTQDSELQQLSENIVASLQAADALINSMLEASRLDAGVVEPKFETFFLKDLFEQLSLEFTALANDRQLDFSVFHTKAAVHSDPHFLRRILQNFLSNALRYTRSGRVLLGCRRLKDNAWLRIEVWDTGPGIPEDKRGEIFQEFRRLKTPQHDVGEKGLGLGLAIADRMSRLLGHRLGLRSWEGRGSVFFLDVPLKPAADVATPVAPVAVSAVGQMQAVSVLCIDNEPSVCAGMQALLEGWGCRVMTASDETQALSCVRKQLPDLILADYQLDETTGLELVQEIFKAVGQELPTIIVTANNTEDVRRLTEQRGHLFMAKPVKPARLRALISSLLTL